MKAAKPAFLLMDPQATAVLYLLAGPAVGAVMLVSASLPDVMAGKEAFSSVFRFAPVVLFYGYLFRGIPAALTGYCAGLSSSFLTARPLFVASSTLIGGGVSGVVGLILGMGGGMFAAFGLGGGFVCSLVALWVWRIR